jgi:hypothetical protein
MRILEGFSSLSRLCILIKHITDEKSYSGGLTRNEGVISQLGLFRHWQQQENSGPPSTFCVSVPSWLVCLPVCVQSSPQPWVSILPFPPHR